MCTNLVVSLFTTLGGRDNYDIRAAANADIPPTYWTDYVNTARVQNALGVDLNYTDTFSIGVNFAFGLQGDQVRDTTFHDLEWILEKGVRVALIYGDAVSLSLIPLLRGRRDADRTDYKIRTTFATGSAAKPSPWRCNGPTRPRSPTRGTPPSPSPATKTATRGTATRGSTAGCPSRASTRPGTLCRTTSPPPAWSCSAACCTTGHWPATAMSRSPRPSRATGRPTRRRRIRGGIRGRCSRGGRGTGRSGEFDLRRGADRGGCQILYIMPVVNLSKHSVGQNEVLRF